MGTPWFSAGDRTEAEILCRETCFVPLKRFESLQPGSNGQELVFTDLTKHLVNTVRQSATEPQIVELDVDENTLGLAVEASKDPHASLVSKEGARSGATSDPGIPRSSRDYRAARV